MGQRKASAKLIECRPMQGRIGTVVNELTNTSIHCVTIFGTRDRCMVQSDPLTAAPMDGKYACCAVLGTRAAYTRRTAVRRR